ncbi:hypothetical protein CTEN210_09447 [Chaetoceros tenuissimus]|uniref:Uncharacterized protein n=1 Tax=Chaetoceros tenuissimus TaxID=426638 RepID=A0AAD3CXJ8_9STRA|nr:hypothetical protein CTEN210_09447 [Chaetoceros tenuissimus]
MMYKGVHFSLIGLGLVHGLSSSKLSKKPAFCDRRTSIQNILLGTFVSIPSVSNAATDEGLSSITDSSIGKSFRKSIIQGARVADNLDEKWERFSDGLRDKNKCDENTGRRLFDNGIRKDGTRIGNPVLGSLCNPEPVLPLNEYEAMNLLRLAGKSTSIDATELQKVIDENKSLVRSSFDRSIESAVDEDERNRKRYNFEVYSTMRSISTLLNNSGQVRDFQLNWGSSLLSLLAPTATKKDYRSPFPEMKDEFEDYDYDKDLLLEALGALTVAFDKLKAMGLIGYFELSIPYDDYGSVVTIAIDDYSPIGAEILLSEQNYNIGGIAQAMVRAALERARVAYSLETFYLDPTTTKQSIFNPTQLLISISSLRKK